MAPPGVILFSRLGFQEEVSVVLRGHCITEEGPPEFVSFILFFLSVAPPLIRFSVGGLDKVKLADWIFYGVVHNNTANTNSVLLLYLGWRALDHGGALCVCSSELLPFLLFANNLQGSAPSGNAVLLRQALVLF